MRPSAIKAATTTAICTATRLDCIPDHHCAGIQHSLFLLIVQEVMTTPMCAVLKSLSPPERVLVHSRSVCLGRLRNFRLQNPGIYVTKKIVGPGA